MAGFRYLLAKSVTGEVLDEVPFTEVGFTTALNAPGGWTAGGLDVTHDLAPLVLDEGAPWARSVFVERGGVIHFGGAITAPTADTSNGTVSAGGQGVLGYYRDGRRTIRSRAGMTYATTHRKGNVAWVDVRTDRIVTDLFDHAAAFDGGELPLELVVLSPASFAITDVILNGYERKGIGEQLDELAAREPGFSYWTTHHFDSGFSPSRVASRLNLAPNAGALRLVPVVLEVGRNAVVAALTIDGEAMANDVAAIGQGQGERMLVENRSAPASMFPATDVPRLEAILNLSDVKTRPALRAIANAELALRRNPAKVVKLTVREDDDSALGTFRPGDDVIVTGHYGAIELAGRWRVLALGATIDADHSVTLDVDLVPSATFDPL